MKRHANRITSADPAVSRIGRWPFGRSAFIDEARDSSLVPELTPDPAFKA